MYYKLKELFTKDEIKYIKYCIPLNIIYCENEIDSASYAFDIHAGKYSSREIALLCICHEYGHYKVSNMNKKYNMYTVSTLYNESLAWHYGLIMARNIEEYIDNLSFDFNEYNGNNAKFIRKCLKSYYGGEYDDLKG